MITVKCCGMALNNFLIQNAIHCGLFLPVKHTSLAYAYTVCDNYAMQLIEKYKYMQKKNVEIACFNKSKVTLLQQNWKKIKVEFIQ